MFSFIPDQNKQYYLKLISWEIGNENLQKFDLLQSRNNKSRQGGALFQMLSLRENFDYQKLSTEFILNLNDYIW